MESKEGNPSLKQFLDAVGLFNWHGCVYKTTPFVGPFIIYSDGIPVMSLTILFICLIRKNRAFTSTYHGIEAKITVDKVIQQQEGN